MFRLAYLSAVLFWLPANFLWAQTPAGSDPAEVVVTEDQLIERLGLKPQSGVIALPGGLAQLNLPEELGYLDPTQTKTVVEKLWGNPPGEAYLGMVVRSALDVLSPDGVTAIITYDNSGYISDKDAASIDFNQLLQTMKESEKATNEQRAAQGFPGIQLIGWAEPPRYDAGSNKLYWAKEIAFDGSSDRTLNYSIRALGRQGVLELNFVSTMEHLNRVKELAPQVLAAVSFTPGNRYADFNAKTDRVAGYGLAALVAGGVAAKAGFFKVILAALIAGKKFVILGAIALFAFIVKLFSWMKKPAEKFDV